MKPATMRFLDLWLGKPACALLTLTARCGRVFGRQRCSSGPPKKILLIKLVEQGATVLGHDAIRRATEIVGRENTYFCVLEENREILDLVGLISPDNVFALRADRPARLALDALRFTLKARRIGIDCVVDLEFFTRATAALAYLTGAERRVGLHRFTGELPYCGDLMTHRVHYNTHLSTAATYRMLVEAVLADPRETPMIKVPPIETTDPPRFVPAEADRDRVRRELGAAAGREITGPIAILNPNTSDLVPLRRWPTERFVELGRRLLADYAKLTIVITGGPSEAAAGAEIARAIDPERAVSMAGRTSLPDLVVLYSLADVLVTNDSGPGHFASLTEIDAVVLFGPETPALFGPLGNRAHVIWAGLACSPCVTAFNHRLSPCRNNVCMQAITVDQVHDRVRELLAARGGDL